MIPLEELAEVLWHPAQLDALVSRYGAAAVLSRAHEEGIAPYLAWMRPDSALLAETRREAVLQEALRHPAMIAACDTLGAAGIVPLVFKGGVWAYTAYPEPWCRPSIDLDLLVRRDDRVRAREALEAAGFTASGRIPGDYVNHQEAFTRPLAPGVTFTVDLHWQLSNRAVAAGALPEAALFAGARPAPFAGLHARQPDEIDHLVMACLHPIAHHPDRVMLMWWLDVARLAARLPAGRLETLRARAVQAGAAGVVAHGLGEARRLCYGPGDPHVPALSEPFRRSLPPPGQPEASMVLLDRSRDRLTDAWSEVRALPTARARAGLVREHLLPPAAFMHARYGTTRPWVLPLLYARRLVGGAARWLRDWVVSRRGAA